MIDLETMSTRPTASVVAIGAYVFDPHGDDREIQRGSMWHRAVSLDDSIVAGLHVDGETVAWWLQQSQGAREALGKDAVRLADGLTEFTAWALDYGTYEPEDIVIWSHAAFDYPILQNAYYSQGRNAPFWYRSPRDLRTIIHAAYGKNLDVEEVEPDFPENPVQHHAGYDAWHQAVMVQYCFRRLPARSVEDS